MNMETREELYRCEYCGVRLSFDTQVTLRHVGRHLGEYVYLPAYHRHLERRGYDELSAHLLTLRATDTLRKPSQTEA
jgi:hypothetical protein